MKHQYLAECFLVNATVVMRRTWYAGCLAVSIGLWSTVQANDGGLDSLLPDVSADTVSADSTDVVADHAWRYLRLFMSATERRFSEVRWHSKQREDASSVTPVVNAQASASAGTQPPSDPDSAKDTARRTTVPPRGWVCSLRGVQSIQGMRVFAVSSDTDGCR